MLGGSAEHKCLETRQPNWEETEVNYANGQLRPLHKPAWTSMALPVIFRSLTLDKWPPGFSPPSVPPTLLLLVSFFCPLLTPRHRLSSHNFFPSHFSFLSSNLHHVYLLSFLFLWWVFFSCSIKMNSCYLSLNWGRSCLVRRALEIGTGLVIKRIFLFLTLKKKIWYMSEYGF